MGIADNIRTSMEESSWIRRMFEAGIELRRERGEANVFDLSLGNPVAEPPEEFRAEVRRWLDNPEPGMHRYMPNAGYTETRQAVADKLTRETGLAYDASHIVMTVGAGGGLNCALHALCDPGDEVMIFTPYFAEYHFYARNHAATPVVVGCDASFLPDLDDLAAKITPRTKAILLNSPNNPSGVVYDKQTIDAIANVIERRAREVGAAPYIISDEPYRKLLFDGAAYPFPQLAYTRTISVTSHSKDLALPGERIGYAAVHPGDPDAGEIMDALVFSNRVLGFVNAPALMQHVVARLQGVTTDVSEYQRKRDFVYEGLRSAGYDVVRPQGAFYAFPKSPVEDELRLVDALFERGVLVVPGRGFGLPGYFRISFCVEQRVLDGALPALREVAAELRGG